MRRRLLLAESLLAVACVWGAQMHARCQVAVHWLLRCRWC